MKRFSIILPVRNGGEYVKLCVLSILSQTLNNFNLIVLDNYSTDGTVAWLKSLNDDRIVIYLSEKSLSIEESWSRVLAIPKNEFITLIGHDDVLEPFYLEEMDRLIAKHPSASLYQSHYNYIDKDGKTTRTCLPMDEIQTSFEFLACQMNNTIDSTGTGYMMRSKDYDEAGGIPVNYPNLIFADYELWIKLGMKSYKAVSQRQCFQYREHLSVSRITNGLLYFNAFEKYIDFISRLKKDKNFKVIIDRYGKKMLLYFCESLAHRLLKTSPKHRDIKVSELIERFRTMAKLLIPDQDFEPLDITRIKMASILDQNAFNRSAFNLYSAFILRKKLRY
jgi:glycosyltransferase involved in cell wall biosynthesis